MPKLVLVLLVLCSPQAVFAADGRFEINQVCAQGPGCFPGDDPGWPVQIQSAGSYVLTSNLLSTTLPARHILIQSNSVSIDLNGFEVRGSAICVGTNPVVCSGGSNGSGIGVDNPSVRRHTIIRNGRLIGASSSGGGSIGLGDRSLVEDVYVEDGTTGIEMGGYGTVRRVSVFQAAGAGISMGRYAHVSDSRVDITNFSGIQACGGGACVCRIERNVVDGANTVGIDAGDDCLVTGNVVNGSGFSGIKTGSDGLVAENLVTDNTSNTADRGLLMGDDTGYRANIVNDNPQGAIGGFGGTPVNMGENFCDGVTC